MLKLAGVRHDHHFQIQPPSGGCVLKLLNALICSTVMASAAFGRLCVETVATSEKYTDKNQPPSGGCVLKQDGGKNVWQEAQQPPSGGCVLKLPVRFQKWLFGTGSRLRAAVC